MKWTTKQSIVLTFVLALTASFYLSAVQAVQAATVTGKKAESTLVSIESISVSGEGDATELVIKLSSPATFTSYKTIAPLRLVIDLSQTTQGAITAPIVINTGNFKTVTASRYDTDAGVLTRVDIELVKDAEAVITAVPDQKGVYRVSFPPPPEQASNSAVAAPTGSAVEAAPALSAGQEPAVKPELSAKQETHVSPEAPVKSEPPAEPAKVAVEATIPAATSNEPLNKAAASAVAPASRTLTSLSVKNDTIVLAVGGGVGEYKSFRLSKPERFVVDLFDVKSGLTSRLVSINVAGIATARLGLYPDKVRVVFDSVSGSLPETVATKSDEGLTVKLDTKAAVENPNTRLLSTRAEKAAEASPTAEKTPAVTHPTIAAETAPLAAPTYEKSVAKVTAMPGSPAKVEMIDFQVIEGISRVAVKVVGEVTAEAPVKTKGFVTLTIKNATLPKRLQRSLETQGFVTPILRVTPILVKTRKGNDTKIRIAMRVAASPEFRQEGDMIYVDFRNPEGLTAEKIPPTPPQTKSPAAAKETELSTELAPISEQAVKPTLDTAKLYKGRKVTLEFADAEVRKIFQLLSEVSNKNFVLGDDVTGTISIKLVNVPWDQALDIILDTKGLDKREDGNIIIIKGKGKFKSQAEEEQEVKKQQFKAIELKTETFNVNYADIGSIVSQFSAIKSERGTIAPDTRTNKVIVKDVPQMIEDMRKLLQQLDVPEKQVMIEARIIEATSTFTRNLGVNWGVHLRDGSASFMGINSLDTGFGGLTSAPPTSGTGVSPGSSMGISFGTIASNIKLDLRLNAAASAGLIKIVSTPKVATLNNKTAKITQGQQIPYTSSTSDKVETKFIEAALALEVTPHINPNGTIGMKIDAKNDSPGQATGGGAPPINKKQATTEMLLRDGETTVIGGIYVDNDTESDDGVPFLMDIPFIGQLFKSNNKSKTKTELLIFITPRILNAI